MKAVADFSPLCQSFFSKRLITQRKASSHTVSAYAQTFRLFIAYAQKAATNSPGNAVVSTTGRELHSRVLGQLGIQPVQ
jgi:integrase/recombinase XerD